jgi:hypothetical protein
MIGHISTPISFWRALVLAAAASMMCAQPYDFGHRTHLTMRLACVRCHPGVGTSTQPPASGEARFSSDACLDCHGQAILNLKASPPVPIAHFSHALHLKLKDQTCESCHHGLLESDKVTDLLNPRMAECAACHKEVGRASGCTLCHAPEDPRVQMRNVPAEITPGH